MIQKLSSFIFSILFPEQCYLCKQEKYILCDTCLTHIPHAFDTPYPYIDSVYSFKDRNLKRIIHAIKYFHRKDLILPFASILAKEIMTKIPKNEYKSYILVPIPMPRIRKYIRGYNHAEILSQEISKITGIKTRTDILIREKVAKRQVKTHSRKERSQNQRGTFTVKNTTPYQKIILVDDVTTTGATLQEARAMLLLSGFNHIEAITIAH